MKKPIYDALLQFQREDRYPFHMPGHKRKLENELSSRMYQWDITEIDGFDDLHDPSGMIRESMEELRAFYQTERTWYLVNGSSSGNLAALGAAFCRGDSVLVARNCHRSVYHGVELFGLKPYYLYPDFLVPPGIYGAVRPEQVEERLKGSREIKGVVLTSPTYEGIVSDIGAISRICQKFGAVLIVDEAHGAHFPFSSYFPDSAIKKGADVVVQSLHKTLAVPNQGALLHRCSGRVEERKLEKYLSLFQTSSPSYVLMAAMEYGIDHGRREKGRWNQYGALLDWYRRKWGELKGIHLLGEEDFLCKEYDRGKIVIASGIREVTGRELSRILLEKRHLQMEMAEKGYFIAMTSYMDGKEGFERLDNALLFLDAIVGQKRRRADGWMGGKWTREAEEGEQAMTPGEAVEKKTAWVDLDRAEGRISGDYVYLYPPGSPILVPGEKIHTKTLEKIQEYLYNEMEVKGVKKNRLCIIEDRGRDGYAPVSGCDRA